VKKLIFPTLNCHFSTHEIKVSLKYRYTAENNKTKKERIQKNTVEKAKQMTLFDVGIITGGGGMQSNYNGSFSYLCFVY
jgi:hypothetical protein